MALSAGSVTSCLVSRLTPDVIELPNSNEFLYFKKKKTEDQKTKEHQVISAAKGRASSVLEVSVL